LSFSPEGHFLATANSHGKPGLWNVRTGHREQETLKSQHTEAINVVAFAPRGAWLAMGRDGGWVERWDLDPDHSPQCIQVPRGDQKRDVFSLALAPNGNGALIAGSQDGTVWLYSWGEGNWLEGNWAKLAGEHSGAVYQVAWSPDGSTFASAGGDGMVLLWGRDLRPRQRLDLTPEGAGEVWSVAFSSDGQAMATGSSDQVVRLWRLTRTGQYVEERFTGHRGRVYSVSFSPDGSTLASASEDATVRLWSLRTRRLHGTLRGHAGKGVQAAAFAPADGSQSRLLASASEDGAVRFWRAATEGEGLSRPR
jgi:WD40 repeat protein